MRWPQAYPESEKVCVFNQSLFREVVNYRTLRRGDGGNANIVNPNTPSNAVWDQHTASTLCELVLEKQKRRRVCETRKQISQHYPQRWYNHWWQICFLHQGLSCKAASDVFYWSRFGISLDFTWWRAVQLKLTRVQFSILQLLLDGTTLGEELVNCKTALKKWALLSLTWALLYNNPKRLQREGVWQGRQIITGTE